MFMDAARNGAQPRAVSQNLLEVAEVGVNGAAWGSG